MSRHSKWTTGAVALVLVGILVVSGGCAKRRNEIQINPEYDDTESSRRTGQSETTTTDGLPPVDVESILFDKFTGLQPIHFDFDSYALRPDARDILKANAEKIREAPGVIVQIEGHCDERGTQDYNLALGERRALATRDYLMNIGVSGDRLVTISYGEEDPVDPGHNEVAWAKNRRCEFNRGRR